MGGEPDAQPGAVERRQPTGPTRRPTVVAALPLKAPARARLTQLLGTQVLDLREAGDHADLVLAPSSSPQLLGRLQDRFPGARIVVVEITDDEFSVNLSGPVQRLLRGGADGYVTASSLDELAAALRQPRDAVPASEAGARELPSAAAVDEVQAIIAKLDRPDVERSVRRDPAPGQ
jgi:hypothetical protein